MRSGKIKEATGVTFMKRILPRTGLSAAFSLAAAAIAAAAEPPPVTDYDLQHADQNRAEWVLMAATIAANASAL